MRGSQAVVSGELHNDHPSLCYTPKICSLASVLLNPRDDLPYSQKLYLELLNDPTCTRPCALHKLSHKPSDVLADYPLGRCGGHYLCCLAEEMGPRRCGQLRVRLHYTE